MSHNVCMFMYILYIAQVYLTVYHLLLPNFSIVSFPKGDYDGIVSKSLIAKATPSHHFTSAISQQPN